jgi:purine-binding chemotaxis protein CheW
MQYLTFRLTDVTYAVDVRIVEAVVEYGGATAVPTLLPYMRGVMDLRGRAVPLIDLRRKFGLVADGELVGTSVIVFNVSRDETGLPERGLTVGAIVDEVSEVVTLDEGSIDTATDQSVMLWERYVDGIAHREAGMVVILRPEALFSLEEIKSFQVA